MAGEVLRFPTIDYRATPAPTLRNAPAFETFDVDAAKRLLELVQDKLNKSELLLELVDNRRADAKAAGIESIAIEICALIEGGRLDAVVEALQESIENNVDAHVTTTGMDRVRRVEKLLAEAAMGMTRVQASVRGPMPLAALGFSGSPGAYIWGPVAFFGLVIIGLVAVAILSPKREKR